MNQSLSALDFCILWQEWSEENPDQQEIQVLVKQFLDTADLHALDRVLALLPEPEPSSPPPLEIRKPAYGVQWAVKSHRVREVSRADFRCRNCGFEITLAQEHPSETEMRLPFDNLECPVCEETSST